MHRPQRGRPENEKEKKGKTSLNGSATFQKNPPWKGREGRKKKKKKQKKGKGP